MTERYRAFRSVGVALIGVVGTGFGHGFVGVGARGLASADGAGDFGFQSFMASHGDTPIGGIRFPLGLFYTSYHVAFS